MTGGSVTGCEKRLDSVAFKLFTTRKNYIFLVQLKIKALNH